jgi:multidrug efflux pump subunit AcrA (membrane-fusion protein)
MGQPLVRLEPREFELALARAESSLRQTYAQLGMHNTVALDAVPPADEQVASVKTAIATLDDAKAAISRAQALAARGILSPVEFRVTSFGDEVFHGKVAYVSPAIDQTMRTFQIEALVDNANGRLKPGFFAKGVILTTRDEAVLAAPDTAVSTLAGVPSVYVIRNNIVTQQQVTLGVRQGNLWEITDGLKGDETLANRRLNELATGTRVRTGTGSASESGGRRGGGRRGQGGPRGGE